MNPCTRFSLSFVALAVLLPPRRRTLATNGTLPVRIAFRQIYLLLSVLKVFLDVFLISLDLPLHLLGDGREFFIRFVA